MIPLLVVAAAACVQASLLAGTLIFAQVAADGARRSGTKDAAGLGIPAAWARGAEVQQQAAATKVTLRTPAIVPGAGRIRVTAASGALR